MTCSTEIAAPPAQTRIAGEGSGDQAGIHGEEKSAGGKKKSPLSAPLDLPRKFIPMMQVVFPCGASSKFCRVFIFSFDPFYSQTHADSRGWCCYIYWHRGGRLGPFASTRWSSWGAPRAALSLAPCPRPPAAPPLLACPTSGATKRPSRRGPGWRSADGTDAHEVVQEALPTSAPRTTAGVSGVLAALCGSKRCAVVCSRSALHITRALQVGELRQLVEEDALLLHPCLCPGTHILQMSDGHA